jgi:hypothetical protein
MLGVIEPYKASKPKPDNIKAQAINLQDYAPVAPNVMNFKQATLNEHFLKIRS